MTRTAAINAHDQRASAHAAAAREAIAQGRRRAIDWHLSRAEYHRERSQAIRNQNTHDKIGAMRAASERARRIRDARYTR